MLNVSSVANYLLSISEPGTARSITHLKLQKLVYYSQGYHLALLKKPIFNERIEAWVHGPVCPALYEDYKNYYSSEIPKNTETIDIPSESQMIIDMVWSAFGVYDSAELEEFTHQEDPWIKARNALPLWKSCNNLITQDMIRSYFTSLLPVGDN